MKSIPSSFCNYSRPLSLEPLMSLRVLASVVLSLIASSLTAQPAAVGSLGRSAQVTAQAAPERISVSFENTPLADALWTIVRRSGLNLTFDRSVLPAKQVTYRADNVTPETAFAVVLKGTGFRVQSKNGM